MTDAPLPVQLRSWVNQRDHSVAWLAWQRLLRHPMGLVGGGLLLVLGLAAFSAPLIGMLLELDGNSIDLFALKQAPSLEHPLGTDQAGRDLLMRLLEGGQISIMVGLVAALLSAVIGTVIGLLSGFYGGRFDMVMMRFTDLIISLPILPVLIILAAADFSKIGLADLQGQEDSSLYKIILIASLFGWTSVARLVRGAVLSIREQPFVLAAYALGAGPVRLMLVHLLPNIISPIIVATTLAAGEIILLESVLSFLGLGIQPPTPSWGNMLTGAQDLIWESPGLALWPGLMIFLTVIAFNLLGDGLQDALDPRS